MRKYAESETGKDKEGRKNGEEESVDVLGNTPMNKT